MDYPAIPPDARHSEVFVPCLSSDVSISVLLHPHLCLLSAASRFCFPFSFSVFCWPGAADSWKRVEGCLSVQPRSAALSGGNFTASVKELGEGTGSVDRGSVILSLAWFSDKPEAVCSPEGGGLMGSWHIEECKLTDLGNTWGRAADRCAALRMLCPDASGK